MLSFSNPRLLLRAADELLVEPCSRLGKTSPVVEMLFSSQVWKSATSFLLFSFHCPVQILSCVLTTSGNVSLILCDGAFLQTVCKHHSNAGYMRAPVPRPNLLFVSTESCEECVAFAFVNISTCELVHKRMHLNICQCYSCYIEHYRHSKHALGKKYVIHSFMFCTLFHRNALSFAKLLVGEILF